jgi:predicted lysophospholipase L1 biosynthesis ABC-type transport system permease subunit
MKNIKVYLSMVLVLLMFTMSSCEVIGDIFQAGMWTAVIIIAIVILLIMWLIRKLRGGRRL